MKKDSKIKILDFSSYFNNVPQNFIFVFPLQKPGDYRIPKTAQTNPDGSRIDISSYLPNKGIIRGDNQCSWAAGWNAYRCSNMDHHMAIIESLDKDTETRRLSPVAILGKKIFL